VCGFVCGVRSAVPVGCLCCFVSGVAVLVRMVLFWLLVSFIFCVGFLWERVQRERERERERRE
jgi:Flp pilus assembly protein TadB